MSRTIFLSVSACIALAVGAVCIVAPERLLESKGAIVSPATLVWVREVGVAILAVGVLTALIRNEPDSRVLRAFLVANLILQLGLFPIEIMAFAHGAITKASGIIPNEILHLLLAFGFGYFALRMKPVETTHGAAARV